MLHQADSARAVARRVMGDASPRKRMSRAATRLSVMGNGSLRRHLARAAMHLLAMALCACGARPAADSGTSSPIGARGDRAGSAGISGSVSSSAQVAGNAGMGVAAAAAGTAGAAPSGGASAMGTQAGAWRTDAGLPDAGVPDAGRMSAAGSGAAMVAADGGMPATAAIALPSELHGVNWADKRDNFVHGLLQLSGLDSSKDTYDTVKAKTARIVAQFRDQLGANTIRIPLNEPTVSSPWWDAYKAVIDTTNALGMNVIVAYWAYQSGKPDDEAAFRAMWQKVVAAYAHDDRVFFDIHNEPSGFSASAWRDEAARWLGYFPMVPRARVIVAGTGSDDNVVPIGSDARFDGCILQLHYYAFWHKDWTTRKQWRDAVTKALGSYASRTLVGEWGAAMANGLDYDTKTPDGNSEVAYIAAMADLIREQHMGSCYWPGLRDGDSYSLLKRDENDADLELSVVNQSGRNRLRSAWND